MLEQPKRYSDILYENKILEYLKLHITIRDECIKLFKTKYNDTHGYVTQKTSRIIRLHEINIDEPKEGIYFILQMLDHCNLNIIKSKLNATDLHLLNEILKEDKYN